MGRFLSPDTIVPAPENPSHGDSLRSQSLNRYAYVLNNPLRYTDPTGHWVESAFDVISLGLTLNDIRNEGFTLGNTVSLITDAASVALPIVPAGISHALRAWKLANKAVNAADTVSDAVKLVNAADTVSAGARLVNSADNVADAIRLQPIVIGEDMNRVRAYVQKFEPNAQTINDFIPSKQWSLSANETWIKQMRTEGREIVDIGPAFKRREERVARGIRPDAEAYNLERKELKGYEGYRKVFERTGKYQGGVPGFD